MKSRLHARTVLTVLLFISALLGGGCAGRRVQAWQRGTFADYTMRSDRDPLASAMAEHTWFSREASAGGRGVGGSGCGCN